MSSISNPFFNYSNKNISSSSLSTSPTRQIILPSPFLTPPLFRRINTTPATNNDNDEIKLKNNKEDNGTILNSLEKGQLESGQFCVENPFTQDECCNCENSCGGGLFDSRISQSSSAVVDSMISEAYISNSSSTTIPNISNIISNNKMLQDSGYRSTISNSNFDEEIAFIEKERRKERDQRRKLQRRKDGCVTSIQQKTREEKITGTNVNNINSSSVPAFLRRTCSNAANGISSIKNSSGWIGQALMKASTSDDNVKRKSFPRRTQSIGCSTVTTTLPPTFLYYTGWMVEADLSSDDSKSDKTEIFNGINNSAEDCIIELDGQRKLGIQRLHELLISRFCFISGMKTSNGYPLITFPDSKILLNFENYQLLIDYLFQINREESNILLDNNEDNLIINKNKLKWIIIIDKRQDRWSNVKILFSFLMNYFPEPIHLIILLKPEGVLQRAIEYGYKNIIEGCEKFKVHICQNCSTLTEFIEPEILTMDLGGSIEYNHNDWTTYRIEIERMKSSARIIAESLGDFGKCLRETELPNDVITTEKVLEIQQNERDAIKEDFRISIRKGLQLLRQVKQQQNNNESSPIEQQQNHQQNLSPCSLQNIAAIERMIAQLQDTEKSFDNFWQKHRLRLISCLELRRFEDEFRKLQSSFAKHMLRLEEHKGELGNSEASSSRLANEHRDYRSDAMVDVFAARTLKERGLLLAEKELTESLNTQGSDSVGPKCDELTRMADALENALEMRSRALEISRQMHSQIGKANDWCRRGVELLSSSTQFDLFSSSSSNNNKNIFEEALLNLDNFIKEGDNLKMDALIKLNKSKSLSSSSFEQNNSEMIFLTSSDTSSLIAQVNERIDDIRRLSNSRRDALRKMNIEHKQQQLNNNNINQQQNKPIQIVSPEKNKKENNNGKILQKGNNHSTTPLASQQQQHQRKLKNTNNFSSIDIPPSSSSFSSSSLQRSSNNNGNSKSCSPPILCSPIAGPMEKFINGNGGGGGKINFVLDELLTTEKTYVRELAEIIHHYIQPFEAIEFTNNNSNLIKSDILFGNIRELHDFHNSILLPLLFQNSNSVEGISNVLSSQRHKLLSLYRIYCRNKPISEELRRENFIDQSKFILECQRRAGHLLPLSAYLLKPIQRITKYQLLLKELIKQCPDNSSQSFQLTIQTALTSMLDLLAQINADMEQLHILGYPGDLRLLGSLRLRTECDVSIYKRAKCSSVGVVNGARRNGVKGKQQRRHLLLFDGGILFCKKRIQTSPQPGCEYFEYKFYISINSLGFAEYSRFSNDKFEIWDINENIGEKGGSSTLNCFVISTIDEKMKLKWIKYLSKLNNNKNNKEEENVEEDEEEFNFNNLNNKIRPQSWTTTSSSEDGFLTTTKQQQKQLILNNNKNKGNNNNSAAQSSRSSNSSSSAVNLETSPNIEDLQDADITFRRHSDSSSSNTSSLENEINLPRSQSQPPEYLKIEEINNKLKNNEEKERIDRL